MTSTGKNKSARPVPLVFLQNRKQSGRLMGGLTAIRGCGRRTASHRMTFLVILAVPRGSVREKPHRSGAYEGSI